EAAVEVARAALGDAGPGVEWRSAAFGNTAHLELGSPYPTDSVELVDAADAVLMGAIAGPEELPPELPKGEPCLLSLRRQLGVWANLRPVCSNPALFAASPLRPERLQGVDILFVRELTGGIYYGEKTRDANSATDVCRYTVLEIERVLRMACDLARSRRKKITMVDKANVLETSRLWRDTATRIAGEEYPDLDYEHVLVDAMAMHLLNRAADFDVIVTENMFGDILTDEASMLAGSMGLLPSAALGDGTRGLFEPVHGTAPDIVGRGIANPYAAISSVAMLLRWSLGLAEAADRIDAAVAAAVADRVWTPDLGGAANTRSVTDAVLERL
ncbi:MAG: 3-isopropylmalate dehydrogenase, partial [Planctomycetota bacterium]|nr:3-isopropylmalate dehydrogenase [Planctomycetota bacterium]